MSTTMMHILEIAGTAIGSGGLTLIIQNYFKNKESKRKLEAEIENRRISGEMSERDTISLMREIHDSQLRHYKEHLQKIMLEFDSMKKEIENLRIQNSELKVQHEIVQSQNKILSEQIQALKQQLAEALLKIRENL